MQGGCRGRWQKKQKKEEEEEEDKRRCKEKGGREGWSLAADARITMVMAVMVLLLCAMASADGHSIGRAVWEKRTKQWRAHHPLVCASSFLSDSRGNQCPIRSCGQRRSRRWQRLQSLCRGHLCQECNKPFEGSPPAAGASRELMSSSFMSTTSRLPRSAEAMIAKATISPGASRAPARDDSSGDDERSQRVSNAGGAIRPVKPERKKDNNTVIPLHDRQRQQPM